jgi:hypothetical protein
MSRQPQRIFRPICKAEGAIWLKGEDPIPFDTELAGPDGCALHLWMGDRDQDKGLIYRAVRLAKWHRDIVEVTYSIGEPAGYWSAQDIHGE